MSSEAAAEQKDRWTTSARKAAHGARHVTQNTYDSAAAAAVNVSSSLVSSARTALSKLSDEDMLVAVKTFVDELTAAAGENTYKVALPVVQIALKYVAPNLARHFIQIAWVVAAMLGSQLAVTSPQHAVLAEVARLLYRSYNQMAEKKIALQEGDNRDTENQHTTENKGKKGNKTQNIAENNLVSKL